MYQIDNPETIAAIESDCRTFHALIESKRQIYRASVIGRITLEHTQTESEVLQLGAVLSRRAEICLYDCDAPQKGDELMSWLYLIDWSGTDGAAQKDLTGYTHRGLAAYTHREIAGMSRTQDPDGAVIGHELIPMGRYTVTRVRCTGSEIRVTAYDRLHGADVLYVPTITFPASSDAVTEDIIGQLGIPGRRFVESGNLLTTEGAVVTGADDEEIICSAEYTFTIPAAPENMTCREVLGAIACMYGGNAVLDREGYFTTMFWAFGKPAEEAELRQTYTRIDEPELDESNVTLSGIICHAGDETYTRPQKIPEGAQVITCECPWMTDARLGEVWRKLCGMNLTWRPGEVRYRMGDPRHDLGDRLAIPFRNRSDLSGRLMQCSMPLTSVVTEYDGGLTEELSAAGSSEGGY